MRKTENLIMLKEAIQKNKNKNSGKKSKSPEQLSRANEQSLLFIKKTLIPRENIKNLKEIPHEHIQTLKNSFNICKERPQIPLRLSMPNNQKLVDFIPLNSENQVISEEIMIHQSNHDQIFENKIQNLLTASFPNQMSRIPTENEHLDERIEIDELEKSSFSERNYLNNVISMKPEEKDEEKDEETLNEAANLIQRIWRGYKTRQLVEEYLKYLIIGREEEQFLEYCPDELPTQIENSVNRIETPEIDLDLIEKNSKDLPENYFPEEELLESDQGNGMSSMNGEGMIVYKESTDKEKEDQIEDFLEKTREPAKRDIFENNKHDFKQNNKDFLTLEDKNHFIKGFNNQNQFKNTNIMKRERNSLEIEIDENQLNKDYLNVKDFQNIEMSNKEVLKEYFEKRLNFSNEDLTRIKQESKEDFKKNISEDYQKNIEDYQKNISDEYRKNISEDCQKNISEDYQKNISDDYRKNISEDCQKNISEDYQKNSQEFQIGSKDFQKANEISYERNCNGSNILHYKEINENSKSLITVKDFEGDYSDLIDKDDYKISNKKYLNFSCDLMMNSSKQKVNPFLKKPREKSSTEFLRDQLMENLKNLESMAEGAGTIPNEKNKQIQKLEEEENKDAKDEQLTLWKEMIENLRKLQGIQLDPTIKTQIQKMEKFSELNFQSLSQNKEKDPKLEKKGFNPLNPQAILFKNKPFLQINIEEENNNANAECSDKVKNTPSEEHPSMILESLQTNFKQIASNLPSFNHTNTPSLDYVKQIEIMSDRLLKHSNKSLNYNSLIIKEIKKEERVNNQDENSQTFSNGKNLTQSNEDISKELFKEFKNNPTITPKQNFKKISFEESSRNSLKENNTEKETCIFGLDPFQEFALKHKSEQKKPQNLIEMRERVLEIRQEAEMSHMKKMLAAKKFSPKSFESKIRELDKWVSNEKNDLIKTKNDLKQSWLRTADAIQKTKRDVAFMKKIGGKDFIDYNMKFSFSQDDLLSKPNFLFISDTIQPFESLRKQEIQVSDAKNLNENNFMDIYNNNKEIKVFDAKNSIENINKENTDQERNKENTDQERNKENSNEKIIENKKTEGEILTNRTKESKENERVPITREEDFEEFKESEESKRCKSEEESQSQRNLLMKQEEKVIFEKKNENEVIKLDFFLDFQEVEEEFNKEEQYEMINPERKLITEQITKNSCDHIENPLEAQIAFQKHQLISESILEDLFQEFLGESFIKNHREMMINVLLKRSPISSLQSKEFDSHFPKALEDLSLRKSQELRNFDYFFANKNKLLIKTENSRISTSSLSVIREYLKNLTEYLLINQNNSLGMMILSQINTPLGYNPLDKLRFLHKNLYKFSAQLAENIMIPYVDREIPRIPVIPNEDFKTINEEIVTKSNLSMVFPSEMKEDGFKLIFNSFNESLDFFRPYSLKGQPNFLKSLKNHKFEDINEKNIEEIYSKAIGRTLEWSETLCGLLPDKEEKTVESMENDMDYIGQLREEKMGRMLAQEVIESEGDWVNYEEEEIEIKLEISQLVWEEFLWQNVNEVCKLIENR